MGVGRRGGRSEQGHLAASSQRVFGESHGGDQSRQICDRTLPGACEQPGNHCTCGSTALPDSRAFSRQRIVIPDSTMRGRDAAQPQHQPSSRRAAASQHLHALCSSPCRPSGSPTLAVFAVEPTSGRAGVAPSFQRQIVPTRLYHRASAPSVQSRAHFRQPAPPSRGSSRGFRRSLAHPATSDLRRCSPPRAW